ncbi:putative mediator of DNA damage checkpoint [Sesbania bispinosa]|nr:putative mediator of DNA damage checkpoint [Sesbania bispinosa]
MPRCCYKPLVPPPRHYKVCNSQQERRFALASARSSLSCTAARSRLSSHHRVTTIIHAPPSPQQARLYSMKA